MKISIIIPTYNSGYFIKDTIESIINQTVVPDEVIIIDDCSRDNTCLLIEEALVAIRKQINTNFTKLDINQGPSEVRNIGLKLATNELVLFMDHDDIAETTMLEKEIEYMKYLDTQGEYVLVHSASSQIDDKGRFISGIHRWKQVDSNEILGYEFVRNQILSMSGVLIKKKYIIEVGGFDKSLKYSQDWDLWLRMAQLGGFGYVDQPLVSIRRHPGNTSNNISNFITDESTILRKYELDFIKEAIIRRSLPEERNVIDYASVLLKLELLDNASETLQQILSKKENHLAFFYYGVCLLKKQILCDAEHAFQRALKMEPNDVASLNNLGCIRLLCDSKKEANCYFDKALAMMPNYQDALRNKQKVESVSKLNINDLRFTYRELRPVLTTYYKYDWNGQGEE